MSLAEYAGQDRKPGDWGTNKTNTPWTDEKIAQLKKLFEEKCSCSVIGSALGMTRNAIIGKLHRMGLSKPQPELRLARLGRNSRSSDGKMRREPVVVRFRPRPDKFKARTADIAPLNIELADLDPHHCRFPYGTGPYTFCGHKKMEGSSYCPDHFALTWAPARERK